jgi:hypothetical protein
LMRTSYTYLMTLKALFMMVSNNLENVPDLECS